MRFFKTPTGKDVEGVLQVMSGVSRALGPDAAGNPDWAGDTRVFWDESEDVMKPDASGKLQRVWICEDGCEWLESELTVEVEDESDGDEQMEAWALAEQALEDADRLREDRDERKRLDAEQPTHD